MTKTQNTLIARKCEGRFLVTGSRACTAAQELVAKGLAKSFENHSQVVTGRTYYNCFTRSYATVKPYADLAGFITF